MKSDRQRLPPELPEWRRSGRFILLAVVLHAAVLFYPFKTAINLLEMPPNTIVVQLTQTPMPTSAEPEKIQPPAAPLKTKQQARPKPETPPVIAMAPAQTPPVVPAIATPTPPLPTPVATPAAPPAPLQAGPVAVERISPPQFDAAYLDNPRPNYPPLSRRLGEEGKVLLRVRVSPDGQAAAVDIEKSSNFVRLDEAARRAILQWRFVPAKRGDKAIEASVIVPFVFRLDN